MATKQIGQPAPIRIILKADGEEYICKYLPTGWRDHSASWIFDYKTFGYNLKYSTEKLRFIKEDADFIRRQIDAYGISAEIDFTVQHRQENWTYADSFTGQVDLSAGYINDRDFVEVDVYEGGLKKAYAANQKTNYELPLSDADAVDIEVPEGIRLYENAKFEIIGSPSAGNLGQLKAFVRIGVRLDNENSKIITAGLQFNGFDGSTNPLPFIKTIPLKIKENKIIAANLEINITHLYSDVHIDFNKTILFYIEQKNNSGNIINRYNIYSVPPGYFNTKDDLKISKMFELSLNTNIEYSYDLYAEYFYVNDYSYVSMLSFDGFLSISYFGTENTIAFSFKALKAETLETS